MVARKQIVLNNSGSDPIKKRLMLLKTINTIFSLGNAFAGGRIRKRTL
jgi:hypothetical protein